MPLVTMLAEPTLALASGPVRYGDVDGDGVPDAVFATASTATDPDPHLVIWHGVGNAQFTPAVELDDGSPMVLPLADVNNGGILDIVTASVDSVGMVHLRTYLSEGVTPFKPPIESSIVLVPSVSLALIADMDADGFADAVGTGDGGLLWVAHGKGDGSFQLQSTLGLPYAISPPLAVDDFNGDGLPDVASGDGRGDVAVEVFLSKSGGMITQEPILSVGTARPGGMEETSLTLGSGDMNGDGWPDIALVARPIGSYVGYMAIMADDGKAHFSQVISKELQSYGPCLVSDLNADGRKDVIIGSPITPQLTVALSDTAWGFSVHQYFAEQVQQPVQVMDIDQDGSSDICLSRSILLGVSPGRVKACANIDIGKAPREVHSADMDSDGALDLVGALKGPQALCVALSDDTGGFPDAEVIDLGGALTATAVGDLNNDSDPDLAGVSSSGLRVYLNKGRGSLWTASALLSTSATSNPLIGDVDGDGAPDVMAAAPQGDLWVIPGDGTGGLGTPKITGLGTSVGRVALVDVDADGVLDVLCTRGDSAGILVALGSGSGFFDVLQTLSLPLSSKAPVIGADIDSDGLPECATAMEGLYSVQLAIMENLGRGKFASPQSYSAGSLLKSLLAGDVDGDGHVDLIEAHDGDVVGVRRGTGDGTLSDESFFGPGGGDLEGLALIDANGDGLTDVAAADANRDAFEVLPNSGSFFADLGCQGGEGVVPMHLEMEGDPFAGEMVRSAVTSNTPIQLPGFLFISSAYSPQEFKGGILVPGPGVAAPTSVGMSAAGRWPAGIGGLSIYFQAWFVGKGLIASTNAIAAHAQGL